MCEIIVKTVEWNSSNLEFLFFDLSKIYPTEFFLVSSFVWN